MKESNNMQIDGPARGGILFAIVLVILLVSATAVPAATTFGLTPNTRDFVYTIGDTITSQQDVTIENFTGSDLTWWIITPFDFVTIGTLTGTIAGTSTDISTVVLDTAAARAFGAGTYIDSIMYFDSTSIDSAFLVANLVVNTAPTLAFIGGQFVNEGALLTFNITALDLDGHPPTLAIDSIVPPNITPSLSSSSVDSLSTGVFTWTAGSQDSGSYTVYFSATDSVYTNVTDIQPVTINVTPVPDWAPDAMVNLGSTPVCSPVTFTNYSILNQSGDDFDLDNNNAIMVDSDVLFQFTPSLASFDNSTIAAGSSILFTSIIFTPTDTLQLASGDSLKMTLNYKLSSGPQTQHAETFPVFKARGCTGVGNIADTLAFGDLTIGQTNILSVSLQNTGSCNLTVSDATVSTGVFSVANSITYPFTIPANGSLTYNIQFIPDTLDLAVATLTIVHDAFAGSCPVGDTSFVELVGRGVDNTAPVIDSLVANTVGKVVDIYVSDQGIGVDTVTLKYRRGDKSTLVDPVSQPDSVGDKDHWQFTLDSLNISPAELEQYGYEIDVVVTDGGEKSDSGWYSISGGFADSTHSKTKTEWLGGNDSTWHLVSIPGDLSNETINRIFQQFSGLPANNNVASDSWRLVRINSWISSTNNSTTVLTTQGGGSVESGMGYWFRHFDLNFDGIELPDGKTHRTDQLFPVSLVQGWNLIGNPFLFAVGIDIDSTIGTISSLIAQNSAAEPNGLGWHSVLSPATVQLQPWVGYAIFCESSTATIFLDPKAVPTPIAADDSWMAEILLLSGGRNSGGVTFGLSALADDGVDMLDSRPVTLLGSCSSLHLKHAYDGRFSQDMRTYGTLQEWELELSPVNDKKKILTWSIDALQSDDQVLLLRDIVADRVIDMTTQSSYEIPSSQQLPENRFRVYLGRTDEVYAAAAEVQSTLPASYKLYQNYPNPFNPTTSISFDLAHDGRVEIEVYNVLGEKVRVLVSDRLTAGSHVVQWDGRSDRGNRVASGVYFAQMKAGDTRSTIKLSLIK